MRVTLRRIFHWPHLVPLLTVLAVVSLILSSFAVFQYAQAQTQRESDRIEADLASCIRGNEHLNINRRIAQAQRDYVDATLEVVEDFADLDAVERQVLTDLLAPARAEINEAIDEIQDINCPAVVLGAEEEP